MDRAASTPLDRPLPGSWAGRVAALPAQTRLAWACLPPWGTALAVPDPAAGAALPGFAPSELEPKVTSDTHGVTDESLALYCQGPFPPSFLPG